MDSVKVFAGPRGSGRTTALLKWCEEQKETPGLLSLTMIGSMAAYDSAVRLGLKPLVYAVIDYLPVIRGSSYLWAVDDWSEISPAGRDELLSAVRIGAIGVTSPEFKNIEPWGPFLAHDTCTSGLEGILRELDVA